MLQRPRPRPRVQKTCFFGCLSVSGWRGASPPGGTFNRHSRQTRTHSAIRWSVIIFVSNILPLCMLALLSCCLAKEVRFVCQCKTIVQIVQKRPQLYRKKVAQQDAKPVPKRLRNEPKPSAGKKENTRRGKKSQRPDLLKATSWAIECRQIGAESFWA